MRTEHLLEARVRDHLLALGVGHEPVRLLVALSGGCDSVVLLYLLRFPLASLAIDIEAAHLDHNMRSASSADAEWVRGLCQAWGVSLHAERLSNPPTNEEEARRRRYAFLQRRARACGANLIATAHHADDQAETVLFRAFRGTGLRGLAGIPARSGRLLRPLLPLWREEVAAYARQHGIRWREDATNASLDPARNRIRHDLLPAIERTVAPAARQSLVSLAALAGEAELALERIAAAAENDLVRWHDGAASLARDRLALYDSAVTSRVLRNLLRHFGVVPGRTGTRRALQFITDAHSGRQMPLSGTLRIEIEFDRALIRTVDSVGDDRTHDIAAAEESGEAEVRIGGAGYRVEYGTGTSVANRWPSADAWTFVADASSLVFPLLVRGWRDGDRVLTRGGSRSLKKHFLEQRVPRGRRRTLPLLVDSLGRVVWVAGLESGVVREAPARSGESFILKVLHD